MPKEQAQAEMSMDVQDRETSPERSVKASDVPALRSLANFLLLNHLEVDPETVGLLGRVLTRFDPIASRAALTTAIRHAGKLHTDRVLWILADRCWEDEGLPPPTDIFLAHVWAKVWEARLDLHPTESLVVRRYGWQNISGQDVEQAAIITAQLRGMYEAERSRVVDEWIAKLSLEAE